MDRSTRSWRPLLALVLALPAAAQTITITPNEPVTIGKSRQFTAVVTGLADPAVSWLVNGMPGGNLMTVGSIAGGLYTAPSAVPPGGTVQVTARSVSNPNVSASLTVAIQIPGPTISAISPQTFSPGPVTLTITGAGYTTETKVWLDGATLTPTYLSPTQLRLSTTITTAGNHFVRVQSPGTSYSAVYTIVGTYSTGYAITVAPATAIVVQGTTQQFLATNTTNPITWTASGPGSISPTGVYTAPATVSAPTNIIISATSPGMSAGNATVTLVSNVPPAISQLSPTSIATGIFHLTINGSGFINGTTATLNGAPLAVQYTSPTQITASGFTTASGSMNLVVANASAASQPYPVQVGVANPKMSVQSARRFLEQASFGPNAAMTSEVQERGYDGWIDWQVALAGSNYQGLGTQGGMPNRFLTNAVMNQDQLRQRIAWAYSQIFVTSLNKLIFNNNMVPYQEMLLNNAFANFRKILRDVTLSPGMGYYLDMANNARGNAAGTLLPNENYAREVLQLFSLGTVKLGYGGVPQTGPGSASYDQATVAAFARAFTGWTYAPGNIWGAYINPTAPMVAYASMHDLGGKQLLNRTLPAGQAAELDLEQAIDDIFTHSNTGYFIGKQLIQKLVKTNPSPAYVEAVAQAFNNPGGQRGDMVNVIRAILTHPEARQNDTGFESPDDGQLQEPALYLPALLRALGATVNDQHYFANDLKQMGQDIFSSPSVFNYYPPGGEIQIYTPATSIYRANVVAQLLNSYSNPVVQWGPGTTFDLSPFVNLAGAPQTLVDAIDLTLMHGRMPGQMKTILTTAVLNESGGTLRRVQTALYLTLTSGYYNVMR